MPNRAMDEGLRAEAAEWVATLHDKVPSSEAEASAHEDNCSQFLVWLRRSPDHVAAFLRADDTFCRLAGMDPGRRINVEDLQARYSKRIEDHERAFPTNSGNRPARTRGRHLMAWAASLLLVVAGAWVWETIQRAHIYTTGIGEQLNVKLPDGSMMGLNTESEAKVEFSAQERRIYLETGEALFEVEHDQQRPFVVVTPSARVRAVGTRFNVYQHGGGPSAKEVATTVSVLEGIVQVAPVNSDAFESETSLATAPGQPANDPHAKLLGQTLARLAAGEQANISKVGVAKKVTPDVSDAIAWRERVLVFHGAPLADVAAEYNRYNAKKIRIEDQEIAQRRMSGTYSADRPQLLVLYLQKDNSISVLPTDTGWVVKKR
jgi:ferric-dicitrate binding protein FerR (iron transport regulator)